MATTALVQTSESEPLALYIRKPEVVEKFSLVLGGDRSAMTYIQSVLLLVQTSEPGDFSLQNCTHQSIVREALRAATLRVSVDPALRQAWLIPRKNSKNGGKLEAAMQFHYAEVRNRAMRTGRYWIINVGPVYESETVLENIYTGLHVVRLANGLVTAPSQQDGFIAVGERRGKVQGWLGYFKTTKGQEQTVYMSCADIETFMNNGPSAAYWKTTKAWKSNRQTMEQKTVLLALLRKADISGPGMEEVNKLITEVDTVEGNEPVLDTLEGSFTDTPEQTEQAAEQSNPAQTVSKPIPEAVKTTSPKPALIEVVSSASTPPGNISPKMLVDNGISKDIASAAETINKLGVGGKPATEYWPRVILYRRWRDAGHDASAAAIAAVAGEQLPE